MPKPQAASSTTTSSNVSRIHIKKGIENLLRATAALKDRLNGYTITIAGMGEETYIQQLKETAKSYGIGHIVRFAGPVFGADKWTLYRNADFFVLPTFSENFGIVVAEALASGTPVITTEGAPWQELNSCGCGRQGPALGVLRHAEPAEGPRASPARPHEDRRLAGNPEVLRPLLI